MATPRFLDMSDDELVTQVRAALGRVVGIEAEPIDQLVQRWPAAMPQYVVGHAEGLERIDAAVQEHPGLHLTGAAYRGVGLAGCVAQGHAVATAIARERLRTNWIDCGRNPRHDHPTTQS